MKRKLSLAVLIAAAMLVVAVGAVLATVITVDGNPTDWPGNPSCTIGAVGCSAVITDAVDVTYAGNPVEPEYDLNHLWMTNDANNLYFRIDTYPAITSTWLQQGVSVPTMNFCFDTDSNTATGSTAPVSNCNLGSSMQGVDHVLTFVDDGTSNPSAFRFRDCTGAWPCAINATKLSHVVVAYMNQGASSESVTEFSVPLADMGFNTGAHVYTTTVAVYYDNGAAPTEDSVPDAPPYPTVLIGCDTTVGPCSPTAITLESLSASTSQTETATLILITVGVVALGVVGGLAVRRKRHAA
jgi:hypothetical protein